MKIHIVPGSQQLQVEDPTVLNSLEAHVAPGVQEIELEELLGEHGHSSADHLWLDSGELRKIAAAAMLTEWLGNFDAMITAARTFGFVDDVDMVRMHIERP